MDLSISACPVNYLEGFGVIELIGEIDVSSSTALRSALDDLHRNGQNRIALDLSQVSYCDSTGIGVLASHAKRAVGEGGALRLIGLRPDVAEIFDIAGIGAVIPIARLADPGKPAGN
jgi:anti-sigma B factor antagonist